MKITCRLLSHFAKLDACLGVARIIDMFGTFQNIPTAFDLGTLNSGENNMFARSWPRCGPASVLTVGWSSKQPDHAVNEMVFHQGDLQ